MSVLIGGGQVSVAIGPQADAVTPATNAKTTKMRHTGYGTTGGRNVWRGEPEIGGTIASAIDALVTGARPRFRGEGIVRLGSFGHLLSGVGMRRGTPSAPPVVIPFAPAADNDNWVNFTWDELYASGAHYRHLGAKLNRLSWTVRPGEPLRFQYEGMSIDHVDSTITQSAEISTALPTPAATILTANLQMFGAATTQLMEMTCEFTANIDTENQAIGSIKPQQAVGTSHIFQISGLLAMTDADHGRLQYGASAGTGIDSALVEGAFTARINTAKNLQAGAPYNIPGYLEHNIPDAAYFLGEMVDITPERMVVLPFVCVPIANTYNFNLLNASDGTAYLP